MLEEFDKITKNGFFCFVLFFTAKWLFGGAGANIFRGHSEASHFHFQSGNILVTAGT